MIVIIIEEQQQKDILCKLRQDHKVLSMDRSVLMATFENDYLSVLKEFLPCIQGLFIESAKTNQNLLKKWYDKY